MVAAIPLAAPAAEETETNVLDPIVVTATRTAEPLSQAAASIAVVTDKDIAQQGYQTFGETLQDIPNVMVQDADTPIHTRMSIRGSDANQITYVIDGVRQDMTAYSGDHPIGIFIDPELIKQTEVKHGGGSALYGNGGIGGTIAVTTKTAADFLDPGENWGAYAKTGYSTTNKEWMGSVYGFGRWNALDFIFGVTHRNGGDTKLSNGKREQESADSTGQAFFAKATLTPDDANTFSLAYNYDDYRQDWLDGGNAAYPLHYQLKQHRVTGGWEYENGPWWNVRANLQYVKASFVYDAVVNNGLVGDVPRGYSDEYYSASGNIQNTAHFSLLGTEHALTVGGDFSRSRQESLTYPTLTIVQPGFPPVIDVDTTKVPDSARPNAKALDLGVFLEDEISLGRYVTVAPQVRYSYFKREAKLGGYPSFSDGKVTPGITLKLKPTDSLSFWASANEGFRPPIMDELYYSQPAILGITQAVVDANPNLKPEKSWNYEVGMNANFANLLAERDTLRVKAVLFYDDVKDFINVAYKTDKDTGVDHYFTENIGKVTRKGAEMSASYAVGHFDATLSYGLVHAINKETDRRIPGITPQSIKLKLGYEIPKTDLQTWYRLNWFDGTDVQKEDEYKNKYIVHYGSFMTHSIGFTWEPKIPNFWDFSAGLAVENLTNKKYRYGNESWGYARALRVWVTGKF